MRRSIILLTTMAMTVLVATSVAMAIERINCSFSGNCYGTNSGDWIHGGGKDILSDGDGKNVLAGGYADDFLSGGVGNDTYDGGPGNDVYKDGIPAHKFLSSDTYFGLKSGQAAITGFDSVYDTGGFDVADLSSVNRSDVWVQ